MFPVGTEQQRKRRRSEHWSKDWLLQRNMLTSDLDLLDELKQGGEIADFKNYLRMDNNVFPILLTELLLLSQKKKNTAVKDATATNFDNCQ